VGVAFIVYVSVDFAFRVSECDGIYILWLMLSRLRFELLDQLFRFPVCHYAQGSIQIGFVSLFLPAWKVFYWMSFVISGGLLVFVIAIRLLSELPSIMHLVLEFTNSVWKYLAALYIAIASAVNIEDWRGYFLIIYYH